MSSQTGAGARWTRALISLLVILVAFGAAWFIPPRLGLDLSGGTQIVLETQDGPDGTAADSENTDKVVEVLRQRIDRLGVAEANMSRSGENRIIVELPGVQDPAEAAQIVGQTAQLSFHPVLGVGESGGGQGVQAPQGGDFANPPADEARAPSDGEGEAPAEGGGEAPAGGEGGEMTQEEMEEILGGMGGDPGGGGMPQAPAGPPAENPEDVAVTLPDSEGTMLQLGEAAIQGDRVSSAEAGLDQVNRAQWVVNVAFRGEGRDQWQELTGQAACFQEGDPRRRVAIVLDDQVISSPQVTAETACEVGMAGGQTTISGDFNSETAEELAVLIEGGSLPLPVTEVQRQTVGPTLGAAAIEASAIAAILGIAFTALYITVVYRMVGFLASLALAFYTLIAYGALVAISATLTLPGLAGFVLAIGMAIDANVLIFERAREEYQRQQQVYEANKASGMKESDKEGKETGALARRRRRAVPPNLEKAFVQGTQKAWSAVLDTNVTTILAAALLFFFASGTVQGFGVTLSLGTIASMISALVIARVFVEWAVRRTVIKKHPSISGINRIGKVRTWLVEKNPQLMNFRRVGLIVAALIVVTAIAAPLVRDTNLGVEFTGGRVLEYEITGEQDLSIDEARGVISALDFAGSDTAVVQESGDGDLSVRTGDISDTEANGITEAIAEETGGVDLISDELIGPSMGDELRNRALIALGAALALQMIYLAWRFRWSFGVSTMVSLAFNMLLVVALFIWLGKPIDGVFLAAILSVIGFTVNDSVVVFDRVRDEWARDDKSSFTEIANRAILNTLPRTVNTTVGAWIILIFLTFLGGSSLQDFSIAMLVGLSTGVVSTVFVAVPIAIWLQKWDKTPAPHVIKERKAKQKVAAKAARDADDGAVV
ncbi:protein translocase subunit SecD [Nocardiopsis sp. NPDC006832]|uniref:protein translocase subunit SecD n=1 Tax=Nocardiopsis sp. NPDC006832 TaxID=3157188 RepID=UPI0033D67F27